MTRRKNEIAGVRLMTAGLKVRLDAGASQCQDWRLRLLEYMMLSRESDIREDILFRQGRGQFHVSSSGHEAIAVLAEFMRADDWIFSHYRDKALMLARGVPLTEIALGYFAKAASSSSGRQMVSHFFNQSLNIASS